ncbi:hypothetical protein MPG05_02705 [Helicobacter pylori]|uniref:hypothetical protein n=1 Tax=Helicobacter pylori TaxID=210 RepID=UPI001FD1E783|nr:hypothetical protein [Helicobacter pylori]UOR51035.1 hypothetical protein MPG05_02705 [Helicobacter pylori]
MKIKLTLKIPLKTPYTRNKVTIIGALFTKKKKTEFHGTISLKFLGVLKTLFGIFGFFNYNHANANNNFKLSLLL